MKMSLSAENFGSWQVYENALVNYWKNGDDTPLMIHTNIAETESLHPSYFFRSESELPDHESELLQLAQGTILDVGAGVGSHSLIMQNRGYHIFANEFMQGCCTVMRERLVQNILHGNFNSLEGRFDTILFIMNGLGMAQTPGGLKNILMKAKSMLNEGGIVLLDAADINHLYQSQGFLNIQYDENYYGIVTYQFEYCGKFGSSFQWLFVDKILLEETARQTGFQMTILKDDKQFGYSAMLKQF